MLGSLNYDRNADLRIHADLRISNADLQIHADLRINMEDLIYEKLTYALNGIYFKVHNKLGRFGRERQYGDAIEMLLK